MPLANQRVEHGASILLIVREGIASDWATLCAAFGFNPNRSDTLILDLCFNIERLVEAGLLVVIDNQDGLPWGHGKDRSKWGSLAVSEEWQKQQSALGVSLVELAELMPFRSFVACPSLGTPEEQTHPLDVFVVMPFVSELKPVYEDHIASVAKSLNLSVGRADDIFKAGSIINDVWASIHSCAIVLADCTGRNANVFYEIGLADSIGKKVILFAQTEADIPFDIKHRRFLRYEYTPRGMKEFELQLRQALESELATIGKDFWGD